MAGDKGRGKKKNTYNTDVTQNENEEILVQIPSPTCKPQKSLTLTEEHEQEIVEWVQANDCLYDKSLRTYKDTDRKQNIWCDKAEDMNVDGMFIF